MIGTIRLQIYKHTYPNTLVPYKKNDSKGFVAQRINHDFELGKEETAIPGIYKQIFESTHCPRCNEQLKFVQPDWKTQCPYCKLWMTNVELWQDWHGKTTSTLLIWDETIEEGVLSNL